MLYNFYNKLIFLPHWGILSWDIVEALLISNTHIVIQSHCRYKTDSESRLCLWRQKQETTLCNRLQWQVNQLLWQRRKWKTSRLFYVREWEDRPGDFCYIIERKDRSVVYVMSWKEMTNHETAWHWKKMTDWRKLCCVIERKDIPGYVVAFNNKHV